MGRACGDACLPDLPGVVLLVVLRVLLVRCYLLRLRSGCRCRGSRRGRVEELDGEHEVKVAVVPADLLEAARHQVNLPLELLYRGPLDELDGLGAGQRAHVGGDAVHGGALVDAAK